MKRGGGGGVSSCAVRSGWGVAVGCSLAVVVVVERWCWFLELLMAGVGGGGFSINGGGGGRGGCQGGILFMMLVGGGGGKCVVCVCLGFRW